MAKEKNIQQNEVVDENELIKVRHEKLNAFIEKFSSLKPSQPIPISLTFKPVLPSSR